MINIVLFYKHMKFRNKARLCLAISDFEAQIMLSIGLCLDYHGKCSTDIHMTMALLYSY